ncbi:MAG: serine/threonine-protein kinase, partial [Candidatus Eisenbacteria bacterium]|nr:serine/threonine-protein kinase [Candidatus Eisenbacteria bacterium]
NLILDQERHLRILDFGLARLEGQESLTISGDVVGTPLYMSPEQARQRKIEVDHRTDVYSLGATMYEVLTGQPPFRGKNHTDTLSQIIERDPVEPKKLNPKVPKDLETIVSKCLRKDPEDRYGTAEALAQDLRRLVRGEPVEAKPQGRWERVRQRIVRNRRLIVTRTLVIGLLLACAWLTYSLYLEAIDKPPIQDVATVKGGWSCPERPLLFPDIPTKNRVALSCDSLTVYFCTKALGGAGGFDVFTATREGVVDEHGDPVPFTEPYVNLESINTKFDEDSVAISPDGKRLYFVTNREGSHDIWMAGRAVIEDGSGKSVPFDPPEPLTELNSLVEDCLPTISRDERFIFFHSARSGNLGIRDIWMASREGPEDDNGNRILFGAPENLGEINTTHWDVAPSCVDGLTLFFSSSREGNFEIYMATREKTENERGDRVSFGNLVKFESLSTRAAEHLVGISWDWPQRGAQGVYRRQEGEKTGTYLVVWNPELSEIQ